MKKRENRTSGFKSKVVLEALQERKTLQEIARKYDLPVFRTFSGHHCKAL